MQTEKRPREKPAAAFFDQLQNYKVCFDCFPAQGPDFRIGLNQFEFSGTGGEPELRLFQPPGTCEPEEVVPWEPLADFAFAPGQAHAVLLATTNPMAATIPSNRLDIRSPPFCNDRHMP